MTDIKTATLKQLMIERPDLIQAIKNGEDEGTITSSIEKDEKKRVKKWTEETKDIDGLLVSKRIDLTSYYETGEVDTIVQQVYDSKGKVSEQEIKHFVDGRKLEVMKKVIVKAL